MGLRASVGFKLGSALSRDVSPARGLLFALFSVALQTAIDGGGALIGRRRLVRDTLADARVVCSFGLSLPATDRLALLLPKEQKLPSGQRDLVE